MQDRYGIVDEQQVESCRWTLIRHGHEMGQPMGWVENFHNYSGLGWFGSSLRSTQISGVVICKLTRFTVNLAITLVSVYMVMCTDLL